MFYVKVVEQHLVPSKICPHIHSDSELCYSHQPKLPINGIFDQEGNLIRKSSPGFFKFLGFKVSDSKTLAWLYL